MDFSSNSNLHHFCGTTLIISNQTLKIIIWHTFLWYYTNYIKSDIFLKDHLKQIKC